MIQQMADEAGTQPELAGHPPRALAAGRLGIVEQMLGDLETATHAGERYTMAKIVGLLRDETAASESRLSELQRRAIKRSLDVLVQEQERMLPDRLAFVARAQKIADVLSVS